MQWRINLLSVALFPCWAVLFTALFGIQATIFPARLLAIVIAVMVVLHELLHVVAVRLLAPDVSVRVGLKRPFSPYVRIEGTLSRTARIVFLLFPFLVITLTCYLLSVWLPDLELAWTLLAAVNAAGSTWDIIHSAELLTALPRRSALISTQLR